MEMLSLLLLCSNLPSLHPTIVYETRAILHNVRRPSNLLYHKYTSTLFFSHTVNKTVLDLEIVAYNTLKNTTETLEVPGGCAIAYDAGNDDIYFGGHDGIYKYNYILEGAEFFSEDNRSIWSMHIGDHFYYIRYPTQQLYVYFDDRFVPVAEAVGIEMDVFYVSRRKDIYYANRSATFKVDGRTRETAMLDDRVRVRQIAQDGRGDVYFGGAGGVYEEYRPNCDLNKLIDIDEVFGITFDDNDNIIYSDSDGIYKLLPVGN